MSNMETTHLEKAGKLLVLLVYFIFHLRKNKLESKQLIALSPSFIIRPITVGERRLLLVRFIQIQRWHSLMVNIRWHPIDNRK